MTISSRLLKYFNRRKSESTDKIHTRYRNDICNHWDLDYMSAEEIDDLLKPVSYTHLTLPTRLSV